MGDAFDKETEALKEGKNWLKTRIVKQGNIRKEIKWDNGIRQIKLLMTSLIYKLQNHVNTKKR